MIDYERILGMPAIKSAVLSGPSLHELAVKTWDFLASYEAASILRMNPSLNGHFEELQRLTKEMLETTAGHVPDTIDTLSRVVTSSSHPEHFFQTKPPRSHYTFHPPVMPTIRRVDPQVNPNPQQIKFLLGVPNELRSICDALENKANSLPTRLGESSTIGHLAHRVQDRVRSAIVASPPRLQQTARQTQRTFLKDASALGEEFRPITRTLLEQAELPDIVFPMHAPQYAGAGR